MATADVLETYIRRQEELFERTKRAYINYKKTGKDRLSVTYIQTKLEAIEKLWQSFVDGHNEIAGAMDKADRYTHSYFTEDMYTLCEDVYTDYKTRLKDDLHIRTVIPAQPGTSISTSPGSNSNVVSEVKLPQIHLPKFNSGYEEWETFHDMFESLIHNHPTLSAVQKLHYLKSCLPGEAEMLLKNLPTTDLNYTEAWNQLNRRYNNKRFNVNEIMKRLFALKSVTNESATAIKQLLDTTSACLKSLNNIKVDTSSWDAIVNYMIVSKLDPESKRLWELEVSKLDSGESADYLPTWDQLKVFMETRFRTLEIIDSSQTNKPTAKASHNSHIKQFAKQRSFHLSTSEERRGTTCAMCTGQHSLHQCKQFGAQDPEKRSEYVRNNGLCFNCLSPTHSVKKCQIHTNCRRCGKRHHTLLHYERSTNQDSATAESSVSERASTEAIQSPQRHEMKVVAHLAKKNHQSRVLLATAMIKVKSPTGNSQLVRALIDQGSESSFISENITQTLNLKKSAVNGLVIGIGDSETRSRSIVHFEIESIHNPSFSIPINAFVLKRLTSLLPSRDTIISNWPEIRNLPLADPTYGNPGKIDVILGAEVYGEILLEGLLKHNEMSGALAQNTQLGWILSGRIGNELILEQKKVISMHGQIEEDQLLKQFWEIEREPDSIEKKMTKEEMRCEEIYEQTTCRDNEGRYVVRLPFKSANSEESLQGQSKEIALRRFKALEKRLLRDPKLHNEYKNVIEEYLALNHMSQITDQNELDDPYVVYLPHHAVVREDKNTTKVRVVFDASSKGVNDVSLNENLLVGPKLQSDLRHIIMRWRRHGICIVADLVKMYRQVIVDSRDTDFQRIFWRSNPKDPIRHYRLLRLTFGTSCAPYLAVKSLQQLAKDERDKYPVASCITLRDYYMNDLLTGCEIKEEAKVIYDQMNNLMRAGGFELQKWCSNSPELLDHIAQESQRSDQLKNFTSNDSIKVLGLSWNKTKDNFEYHFHLPDNDKSEIVTKRMVLSQIARLYDPMGWIAPIIITAKVFIQKLWKSQLTWDETLTSPLLLEWQQFTSDLPNISKISIPRWLQTKADDEVELHAFADASKSAYAAVVYLKSTSREGRFAVNLVTAKTKVAPVEKEISIPRLELCAALLATKLAYEVCQIMNIPKTKIHAWSDSKIVLAWIAGEPSRWSTFVSNRVSEILTILSRDQWKHVATDQNPADCASRGMRVHELIEHQLWWNGPSWLQQNEYPENININFQTSEETRAIKALTTTTKKEEEEFIWMRFSNIPKMLRVLSYCKKFLYLKLPKEQRENLVRTVNREENEEILKICIKQTQAKHFREDLNRLKSGKSVTNNSQLRTLSQRYKWTTKISEPEINDVVLIRDSNIPPARWLMGRIVEKHTDKDNITRVVSIKTKSGTIKRPCNKLCSLPKAAE